MHSSLGDGGKALGTGTRSLAAGSREERQAGWLGHNTRCVSTSERDLEQAPLPFRATVSSAIKGRH